MFDWMKFRFLYFSISGIVVILSLYAILSFGFKKSIDFTGGSIAQYSGSEFSKVKIEKVFKENNLEPKAINFVGNDIELKFGSEFNQARAAEMAEKLTSNLGNKYNLVRFETVGPSVSKELLQKTYAAVIIASLGILTFVAFQFQNLKFGIFAIIALVHDLIILLGTFAYLGHTQGVELDILVVTAILTILSLSLYDTIVVYDRIRESRRSLAGPPIAALANKAISETIVRSLNTSLTTILVLFALFLFGGESIHWFVLALLIGAFSGTYSSPFVAVALMVTWENFYNRLRR